MANSRVSTKEFYEALLNQNDRMDKMERRIIGRLDDIRQFQIDTETRLAAGSQRFKDMEVSIATNRTDIRKIGGLNGLVAVIGSVIAGILGTQK